MTDKMTAESLAYHRKKVEVEDGIYSFDAMMAELDRARQTEEDMRASIGAAPGENWEDAILRYTAQVQIGCARRLEQHARKLREEPTYPGYDGPPMTQVAAALTGGASLIRQNLPKLDSEEGGADAIARWKAEMFDRLKTGLVEHALPRFWAQVMGDLPSDAARAKLREILEGFELGDYTPPEVEGPTQVQDEQDRPEGT
jgi:hypothetical protein